MNQREHKYLPRHYRSLPHPRKERATRLNVSFNTIGSRRFKTTQLKCSFNTSGYVPILDGFEAYGAFFSGSLYALNKRSPNARHTLGNTLVTLRLSDVKNR